MTRSWEGGTAGFVRGRLGMAHLVDMGLRLKAEGVSRVLVLPAYPQYSSTTTARWSRAR